MNLIELLRGSTIEGFTDEELSLIIQRRHESIRIRTSGNGVIVLSNNKIIKCVKDYYRHPTKPPTKPKGVNVCHTVHRDLEINGVPTNNCEVCHLACMAKKKTGQLRAAQKKSSTKRRR